MIKKVTYDENMKKLAGNGLDWLRHRRRKYGGSSPDSLRPIFHFGSIWELHVLGIKTKVFCRKKNKLHFPMDKELTVPK